ncbi:MAG: cytochrome c3 family protein, partial [Gemmatimonadales bacterium]
MPESGWLRSAAPRRGATRLGLLVGGLLALLPAGVDAQDAVDTAQGFVAPAAVDTTSLDGPRQPIFYRHDIHAGQYQLDCRYCHFAAEISTEPGLPTLSNCMGCHLIISGGNRPGIEGSAAAEQAEIALVRQAFSSGESLEWVRVHNLPSFVRFPHMRHVNADVTCQQCHGPIEQTVQVYQYAPLKMGWCLDCHKANDATTD